MMPAAGAGRGRLERTAAVAVAVAAATSLGVGSTPAAGQTFSGQGTGATPLFVLASGTTQVSVHAEDPTFTALLVGTDGSVAAELNADPRQSVTVEREGWYLFEVRAGRSWRIAVEASDSLRLLEIRGRLEGAAAAEARSSAGWLGRGLGAGLVLGPVGTLFVVDRAARGDLGPGPETRARLEAMPPLYQESFEEAFATQRRADRRAAALVGGLTGTAVLAFVILQLTVWGDGGGSGGPGPDPGPAHLIPSGLQLQR